MTSEPTYYNPIHKFIGMSEDFLPLISATAIGGVTAGPWGAITGFALGSADITAKYFEIYDQPYLTSAVLGAGIFSRLTLPYHAATIIGGTIGLLIPTGMLNSHFEKASTPASAALYGYSYGGAYGAAAGFTCGVIDETLHGYNITSQYYLSTIIKNIALSNLILPFVPTWANAVPYVGPQLKPVLETTLKMDWTKESVGIIIGAIEAHIASKPERWAPIKLAQELYEIYSKILDEEELKKLITNQALSVVTTSIITQSLLLTLAQHFQETRSSVENLKTTSPDPFPSFLKAFQKFAGFFPLYVTGHITSSILNSFFNFYSYNLIEDKLNQELTSYEMISKLIKSNSNITTDANTLIKRRYSDISTLSSTGARTLSGALSIIVKGCFGVNYMISVNAQDIILYSMLYNDATNSISTFLSSQAMQYDTKIHELEDKKASLDEYLRTNADSITQRNSNQFTKYQLDSLSEKLRIIYGTKFTWTTIDSVWSTGRSIADFLINTLVLAYHINIEAIKFEDYYKISFTSDDISTLFSWSGQNAGTIISINQSTTRLNEFIGRMRDNSTELSLPIHSYKILEDGGPWICFDNLEVKAGNTSLITAEHQCLSNSINSVTGESKSGKSTTLKLVNGLLYSIASGSGNITFYTEDGQKPSIVMASQHDAFPPYTTLIEAITLKPLEEAKKQEELIRLLMKEMQIDSGSGLDISLSSLLHEEKEDWGKYITSGGLRKKLMSLWVILEKPSIAILDEIFAGLDRESVEHIQSILKKYLPETRFLIVDHEASTHNFDGFYQSNLHVANKTLHVTDVPYIEFSGYIAPDGTE